MVGFSDDLVCIYLEIVVGSNVGFCLNILIVGFVNIISLVEEGNVGISIYDVSIIMNNVLSSDVIVEVISVEDIVIEGVDYDVVFISVVFIIGEVYFVIKMVSVMINGDEDVEVDEIFDLLLSFVVGSVGLVIISDDQYIVIIMNDDVYLFVINEIYVDFVSGLSGDVNGDGIRNDFQDEFIEFYNNLDLLLDILGFIVLDGVGV